MSRKQKASHAWQWEWSGMIAMILIALQEAITQEKKNGKKGKKNLYTWIRQQTKIRLERGMAENKMYQRIWLVKLNYIEDVPKCIVREANQRYGYLKKYKGQKNYLYKLVSSILKWSVLWHAL